MKIPWNKVLVLAAHAIAGALVHHGLVKPSVLPWLAALGSAAVGWLIHNPPPADSGLDTLASKAGSITSNLKVVAMLFAVSIAITGCSTNPSKSHVIRAVATGTKVGITQNPTTGIYEFGISRVQTEIVTVPIYVSTNSSGVITMTMPDMVSRYEVNTHSAVFGNAALTSTLATGSNGVSTQVGGTIPPINAGTGTNNNLIPTSH